MATAVIYTAPECPHSKKLREFLKEKGVQYEEKCVLTNPETFEELAKISGHKAIPVAVVGEDVFVGFDRRVERRLGRRLGG
jgi:glutaredoxin